MKLENIVNASNEKIKNSIKYLKENKILIDLIMDEYDETLKELAKS